VLERPLIWPTCSTPYLEPITPRRCGRGVRLCDPILAGPEGLEPPTYRLEGDCSVR
jgi:hypothetical protein